MLYFQNFRAMKFFFILSIFCFNFSFSSNAQFPQQEWKNTYSNITSSVQPALTGDGGFIVASVENSESLASNPIPKDATEIILLN